MDISYRHGYYLELKGFKVTYDSAIRLFYPVRIVD